MKEKVKVVYEYLFKKISGGKSSKFRYSEREEVMIDNFCSRLTMSHGDDWIWNYMCYQFCRYDELDTKVGKGKVMLGWVVGKKAFDKYLNASEEEKFYGEEIKRKYDLRNPIKILGTLDTLEYKERERKRFYGTERGLVHCVENELYSKISRLCMFCKFNKYCNSGE
jgi:hypothetical protein